MIKYFIKLGEEQKGPLSIEELKEMNLTDQYLYWIDGLASWRKITEIKELEGIVLKLPPSEDKNSNEILKKTQKYRYIFICIVIVCTIIFFALLGGFSDKYDLLDNYPGLASSSYGSEAALKMRGILLGFSIFISCIIGSTFYFYQMMLLYKKIYEKKDGILSEHELNKQANKINSISGDMENLTEIQEKEKFRKLYDQMVINHDEMMSKFKQIENYHRNKNIE